MSNNISGNNVNQPYPLNFKGNAKKAEEKTAEPKLCDCSECANTSGLDAQGAYAKGAMNVSFKGAYKPNSKDLQKDVQEFQNLHAQYEDQALDAYFNRLNETASR